jgi:hypothetical protein
MTATLAAEPTATAASYRAIAVELATLQKKLATLELRKQSLLEALSQMHADGDVAEKFSASGFNFTYSQGKRSVVYSPELTDKIKRMQAYAVKMGRTETKLGKPYWTIRPAASAVKTSAS